MQHSRLAAFWTGAGVLATLAVLPYVFAIDPSLLAQLPMPLALVVVAQTAQTGILLLLLKLVGLRHLTDSKLKPPTHMHLLPDDPALAERYLAPTSIHSPRPVSIPTTAIHAPPQVRFLQHRITTPLSHQDPVSEWALDPHALHSTTEHARLSTSGLPSGQTSVREWPHTPLPEQSSAAQD